MEDREDSRPAERKRKQKHRSTRRSSEKKYTWKHQLCKLPFLLLLVLGLLIPTFMKNADAAGVERIYSGKIYPVIAKILSAPSSFVNFSIAEIAVVVLTVLFVLIFIIRLCKLAFGKLRKRHINRVRFFSFLISLGIFAGIMLNLFYCFWGFNNYRVKLADSLQLDVRPRSVDELAYACEDLADRAAALRTIVTTDENGIYTIGEYKEAFEKVKEAYENLGSRNQLFNIPVHKAKPVFASKALSKMGIAGIYTAYTAEMNVNVDQPDLYILADAAHETAHYMGFAREDEANFLAFYVSFFSDDANFRYSAAMHALANCSVKLYEQDSGRYYDLCEKHFTDGMKKDLDEYREYFNQIRDDPVKTVSDKVNDAYLKHNGQTDGIKSYGNMIDLILAYYALMRVA